MSATFLQGLHIINENNESTIYFFEKSTKRPSINIQNTNYVYSAEFLGISQFC